MIGSVELCINAVDAPTTVFTWEKDCESEAETDLTRRETISLRNVHPPKDLGQCCDGQEFSKSAQRSTNVEGRIHDL